jgi:hypothetical protein
MIPGRLGHAISVWLSDDICRTRRARCCSSVRAFHHARRCASSTTHPALVRDYELSRRYSCSSGALLPGSAPLEQVLPVLVRNETATYIVRDVGVGELQECPALESEAACLWERVGDLKAVCEWSQSRVVNCQLGP